MLDNEPNDPAAPAAGTPDEPAAPVKAVRRRRATKAAAAPEAVAPAAADPAVAEAPFPTAPVAASDVPLEGGVSAAGETPGTVQDPAVEAPAEAAAPAKRVRKAPAKKAAPRKRVSRAGAGSPPADAPTESTPDVPAAEPTAEAAAGPGTTAQPGLSPDDEAVVAVLEQPGDQVVDAVEEDPAVAESTSDDAVPEALVERAEAVGEEPVAPAPRTRRRRAPAVVTFQAPVAPDTDDEPAATEPAADQDEAPAPRRRRRAGTTGAVAPAALLPTLLAPEHAPAADLDDVVDDAGNAPTGGPDLDDGDDAEDGDRPRRRRRGRRGRGPRRDEGDETTVAEGDDDAPAAEEEPAAEAGEDEELNADGTVRRRRRRRRSGSGSAAGSDETADDVPTVVHVREPRAARVRGASAADEDGVRGITGSTRMAAKRARRQEGRDSGRRRPPVLSEAEFLARREAVDRTMVVRQQGDRTQIAVLEDGVLVEHYVTKASAQSYAGNVYLGKVQNVLPSMEAAFVDIGKGKNGVLYAGEVNYDAQLAGHGPRKIESVLKSGQDVLVQVSKDPIGHKGARLTSQVSLPGRYLVYVPEGSMTGISRKLPDTERTRLKSILKKIVPDDAGVIIRTAAEGASEEELTADVRRLQAQWETISAKAGQGGGPVQLHAEPDLVIRVVRDVFNEDFTSLVVQGDSEWDTIRDYVEFVAPDLAPRLSRHDSDVDVFAAHRVDEQLAKALDRKVWLPSGGSLVIDRTEAMVVIDVNTGKYVGKGGNLEETVTRNNLEAAEEIARQLRLRDLGGIIVVDFIDMVLESNRDLVVRRLVECLGRDRTKHQVAEVTSLGLVQMTRKRVGQGLLESFSETCEACGGRGVIVHAAGVDHGGHGGNGNGGGGNGGDSGSRPRRRDTAGPALVAAAAQRGGTAAPAAAATVEDGPAAGGGDDAEATAGNGGRSRRRRGGRGAGAARAAAAAEAKQEADEATGTPEPDDAALSADVQDLADLAPDLVPEVGDQPSAAEEDLPVFAPDGLFGGGDEPLAGEPVDADPAPSEPTGGEPAGDETVDAGAVDAAPVDLDQQPEPEAAPEAVEVLAPVEEPAAVEEPVAVEEPAAAPRRRRRATSRPAGPPTA